MHGQSASAPWGKEEDNREEKNVQQPIPIKAGPAFLFDLDGTLVDSVYQHVLAWREALEELGIELAGWRIHRRVGMSGGLVVNALLREIGRGGAKAAAARLLPRHQADYARQVCQVCVVHRGVEL